MTPRLLSIAKYSGLLTLIGLGGCRVAEQRVMHPLDVNAVPQYVKNGMAESEIRGVLGKPHQVDAGSSTYQGVTNTYETFTYWNPDRGYRVALVSFVNGLVSDVQVKNYPAWVVLPFNSGGSTPEELRKAFGNPSRVAISSRSPGTVYWVYTDSQSSHRTLVVCFKKGRKESATYGPNREDWDNGQMD